MKLPKYVDAWVDGRDGRAYYYLRRRGFPRVRLPGLPWSPSFMAAYEAALAGPRTTAIGASRIKPGSVSAVVAEYFDSQQFFGSKKAGTQRMRRGILERFRLPPNGDRPFAMLPPEWIEAQLDNKPPQAARSWLVTLRSLCQFAVKRGYRRDDPTANVKLPFAKSDGFHTWTDAEIAQFEAHHPIGTKPRLALALLFYTAQRRGDVVHMGRQHIRETPEGPALYVKQRKTGVELLIPIHPELSTVLNATPSEHLTFLVTATGKPYGDNHFSESFREWCDAAGLPKRCSAHGLRKARCRWLAEHGCSGNEIMAHSGHATMKELVRYTKAADQARLARNAMTRTTTTVQKGAAQPMR
jgi:integrase